MAKKQVEKVMQSEIVDSAHKIWLAGLGALASAEQEGSKVFKTLVTRGEKFEARGKEQIEKTWDKVKNARGAAEDSVESTVGKISTEFDDRVGATLKKLGVPSRNEIKRLTKRVEELNKKVDQLKPKKATASKAKKTTARKTTARKTTARKTAARRSA